MTRARRLSVKKSEQGRDTKRRSVLCARRPVPDLSSTADCRMQRTPKNRPGIRNAPVTFRSCCEIVYVRRRPLALLFRRKLTRFPSGSARHQVGGLKRSPDATSDDVEKRIQTLHSGAAALPLGVDVNDLSIRSRANPARPTPATRKVMKPRSLEAAKS